MTIDFLTSKKQEFEQNIKDDEKKIALLKQNIRYHKDQLKLTAAYIEKLKDNAHTEKENTGEDREKEGE